MIKSKFKYGTEYVNMELGWLLVNTKLSDLGLEVLNLLDNNAAGLTQLLYNDVLMLKVFYFYVTEERGESETWEKALETLDKTEGGLEQFKNAFFDMVVGFSPPTVQPALRTVRKELEKRLKDPKSLISNTSSSASSEESE